MSTDIHGVAIFVEMGRFLFTKRHNIAFLCWCATEF